MSVLDKNLVQFMLKTTIEAGQFAAQRFNERKQVTVKSGPLDLVCDVDQDTNRLLVKRIKKEFPSHGIISEEMGIHGADREFVWVIDPIDGTLNYIRGVPNYGVIVSLRQKEETRMGCVYVPTTGEIFYARKNKGSYRNGARINCSDHKTLRYSLGFTNDSLSQMRMDFVNKLGQNPNANDIWASSNGCTAISCAQVAQGVKDWYVCSGSGKIWDYDATVLLMREAGCLVTNTSGKPWEHGDGAFIAANHVLHKELIELF